jgi:hypothetical protein
VAALVLAFDFDGPRAVRAEDAEALQPSLQEVIVGPIMQTVQGLEQRLRNLDTEVGTFTESFTSRRIAAQTLCVSDEGGAQTCITKAQLDLLLSKAVQADLAGPSMTTKDASAQSAEPFKVITAAPERPLESTIELTDQEVEHTGTAQSAVSGAAVVWHPEVEISVVQPSSPSGD